MSGDTISIEMVDGVKVVVPNSLNTITSYVLLEQGDWFEDELRFLRRMLVPGSHVVDIGANFGVYTLSMAKAVGADGRVWAFEPAARTARLLSESVSANGFLQVYVDECALSDWSGFAMLSVDSSPELNALVDASPGDPHAERVRVSTLDEIAAFHGIGNVAFAKIDAEGEEARILQGGARFFAERSPLVQYEVKAGAAIHLDLVQRFAELGYRAYRLVPGLDLLVPFAAGQQPDPYLLNLFACKPHRAAQLLARGFLMDDEEGSDGVPAPPAVTEPAGDGWIEWLMGLPYARALQGQWALDSLDSLVEQGLRLYVVSRDAARPKSAQFAALTAAVSVMQRACSSAPTETRLCTLARMAAELGSRAVAVDALSKAAGRILERQRVELREPFLAPCDALEAREPGQRTAEWFFSAVLEATERPASYSSCFAGAASTPRLQMLMDLGFASDQMRRRLDLLRLRMRG